MGTNGRHRHKPISETEQRWLRILYRRGLTLREISAKTGISKTAIGRLKQAGRWEEDRIPTHTPEDVIQCLDEMIFVKLLFLLTDKTSDSDQTRAILDVKNLASTLRDVQELISAVDNRSLILSLQKHMTWLSKHPELKDALEAAQIHHDKALKML